MMNEFNRREFLKLLSLIPVGYTIKYFAGEATQTAQDEQANVLIVVFDALSAGHLALHGYRRDTMPNLSRLVDRAVVYHQHHAGGAFTSPGTASLLTGTLPWTNRVFQFNGKVKPDLVDHNLFNAFSDYYRLAYSHNPLVNTLFKQFEDDLNFFKERQDLFLTDDNYVGRFFQRDYVIANQARRTIFKGFGGLPSSLFLPRLYINLVTKARISFEESMLGVFPRGLPSLEGENHFVLEDAVDWLVDQTQSMPKPFLGYFHLYPPHDPYKTRREYVDVFKGTHAFPDKPVHLLSTEGLNQGQMKLRRQLYDESILYVDAEFNRLYSELESNGILENTYLVLTADHGELFERGLSGHFHRLLYQGVTHIPLVIFPPGHQERVDITIPTSAVDVLPTLLHLTGHTVPEWAEGFVLPPFGPAQPTERPLFTIEAKDNRQFQPLTQGTISMVTWPYKLIFYMGYKELGEMSATYELYNLANDPDELVDLYNAEDERSQRLANALQAKLDAVNIPYR